MRKQFNKTLKNILYSDKNTVLLLGDIGVFAFRQEIETLSDRVYNIGILEQSTISIAAGISKSKLIPFVHTIAPFITERALEQIKIDFAYQKLAGNLISVGASYDYAALGCTHHCPADISILLSIPNCQILIPGSSKELDKLILSSYNNEYLTYTRLSEYEHSMNIDIEYGKGLKIKSGKLGTVIVYGPMLEQVYNACKDIDITLLYYTSIAPFDNKLLLDNFNRTIIICEPFYAGTTNYLINQSVSTSDTYKIYNIGIPREFLSNYGTKQEQDEYLGLDSYNIKNRILQCLN